MKESISYSFLLNIVIVFIFICAAIVMGMFSYNKAFRANTIILRAIEKYEGYNCASKEEISKNLGTIGYNVPFTPTCKKSEKNCVVDETNKFKVVPYNLDGPTDGDYVYDTTGSVYIRANGNQTQHYRYAITTYMYIDVPVVNQLIRMSVTSRTNTMYEFRDLMKLDNEGFYDEKAKINKNAYLDSSDIIKEYTKASVTGGNVDNRIASVDDKEYNARTRAKYDVNGDGYVNSVDSSQAGAIKKTNEDYGTCKKVKSYDNY